MWQAEPQQMHSTSLAVSIPFRFLFLLTRVPHPNPLSVTEHRALQVHDKETVIYFACQSAAIG
jgi:hypothetical protein